MRRGGGNCCRHGAGRDSQLAGVVVMKPRALTMTVEALDARFQTLLGDLTRMPQPSRPNVRAHSMYPIYTSGFSTAVVNDAGQRGLLLVGWPGCCGCSTRCKNADSWCSGFPVSPMHKVTPVPCLNALRQFP